MSGRLLTHRELNRATLARQLLLERASLPVAEAVERVAGLQAQVVKPPFVGLWARLQGFAREDLVAALERREVVRAAAMRATIHLVAASDYLRLWTALHPALVRAFRGFNGPRIEGLDLGPTIAESERLFAEPRTFAEVRPLLAALEPGREPLSLAAAARAHLPLVQVPEGAWGFPGSPRYVLADRWLGEPAAGEPDERHLVRRYLAAFGPASVADLQAWAGRAGLAAVVDALRPELEAYRTEEGRELLDLPDAPLPDRGTPAPPRFLPDYDSVLLAHADRTRVLADEHRRAVFTGAGVVRPTILVDGFVAGRWRLERARGTARVVIEPFVRLPRAARAVLLEEGERLAAFLDPAAKRTDATVASG